MWKDYSIGFIKKNRASSVSVLVAAFISALFLSLLCGLFYNFWNYESPIPQNREMGQTIYAAISGISPTKL